MAKRKAKRVDAVTKAFLKSFKDFEADILQGIAGRSNQQGRQGSLQLSTEQMDWPRHDVLQAAVDARSSALAAAISEHFNNASFADVHIRLGHFELPAHQLVLASQSGYFSTALCNGFQESKIKRFEYQEGSLQAYWRVFQYMYTGSYSDDPAPELDVKDDDQLFRDVRVYALAEYFDVRGLKEYALQIFETRVRDLWVSESFVDCIKEVYSTTDDSHCKMRELVVKTVKTHLQKLMAGTLFRDLIREGGDFVVDLTNACSRSMED